MDGWMDGDELELSWCVGAVAKALPKPTPSSASAPHFHFHFHPDGICIVHAHTVHPLPPTPRRASVARTNYQTKPSLAMDLHYGARVGEAMAVGEAAYIATAGTGHASTTGPASAGAVVDVVTRESAAQALGTVVQLHFDKTVEKKRAADAQKQELWRLFLAFFLLLSLVLSGVATSPPARLQCRHLWAPAGLLSLAHLAFYAAVAHHLRCLNGFRYQRRCHKLTLALAADRLRMLKSAAEVVPAADVEVPYQEPPEAYLAKFRRSWAIHFAFLITTFAFSVAASVAILCF